MKGDREFLAGLLEHFHRLVEFLGLPQQVRQAQVMRGSLESSNRLCSKFCIARSVSPF